MSEFKFECPVCGQHITADSSAAGTHLECPTCFQKIVVPQAPATGDPKFILSAAKVTQPRPNRLEETADLGPLRRKGSPNLLSGAVVLGGLLILGAAGFFWRHELDRAFHQLLAKVTPGPGKELQPDPAVIKPVKARWTLDLDNAVIPDMPVAGKISGQRFYCDQPTLVGGALLLRQGDSWPPEFGIGVLLPAKTGEELDGKTVTITPDQVSGVPRVLMRWRPQGLDPITKTLTNGYALKLTFGHVANGRMPGRIFIALPDETKSYAAGTFDAEIRKPERPRSR